jgi:hypothetical protein
MKITFSARDLVDNSRTVTQAKDINRPLSGSWVWLSNRIYAPLGGGASISTCIRTANIKTPNIIFFKNFEIQT